MRGRIRSVWLTGVALVCALAVAGVASASPQLTVAVSPKKGASGTEVTVQPSIDGTVSVGDKVDLYVLDASDVWQKWGEGQMVEANEETGAAPVIEPMFIHIDESLSYPAVMRAVYVPKSGSPNATATSEPFTLRVTKNARTRVSIAGPASVKRNQSFTTLFQVAPNSGVGKVRVTIKKIGGGGRSYSKAMTLTTDEEGGVAFATKLATAGRYQISAKFLGTSFGVASPTASRTITVR